MASILDETLELEQQDTLVFRCKRNLESFRNSLFGGQVVGQALMAAYHCCKDKMPHSLHGYFLRAGDKDKTLDYHVKILRQGRSFDCLEVKAIQDDVLIYSMHCSFHVEEKGYEHQKDLLHVPKHLLDDSVPAYKDEHINVDNAPSSESSPFIFKGVHGNIFSTEIHPEAKASFWLKAREDLSDKACLHASALAFVSDLGLLATSLLTHPTHLFNKDIFAASLDHSMWFHNLENLNINNWLLYNTDSPWAGNGRGFNRGQFYTPEGILIASSTQEGLIRPRS